MIIIVSFIIGLVVGVKFSTQLNRVKDMVKNAFNGKDVVETKDKGEE